MLDPAILQSSLCYGCWGGSPCHVPLPKVIETFESLVHKCSEEVAPIVVKALMHKIMMMWTFVCTQKWVPSTLWWRQWRSHSPSTLLQSALGRQPLFGCYKSIRIYAPSSVFMMVVSGRIVYQVKATPYSDCTKSYEDNASFVAGDHLRQALSRCQNGCISGKMNCYARALTSCHV